MRKQPVLLLFCLLLLGGEAAGAAEWYLSNPAGMPLEKQSSALVALRNKYSLSVERVPLSEVPDMLREYHNGEWIIEVHILFENGEESRRQWIFRNKQGIARLVSAFDPPAPEDDSEAPPLAEFPQEADGEISEPAAKATGKAPSGFIELYDENNRNPPSLGSFP